MSGISWSGRAPRSEVHRRGLLHRAVQIFVFHQDGRLLLQLRSMQKDEWPGVWTSSASGHVDAGEAYDAAAKRELYEELQLEGDLERLAKFPASPQLANEHTVLYRMTTSESPVPDPLEVDDIDALSLEEIQTRIITNPAQFAPTFLAMFAWYMENCAG